MRNDSGTSSDPESTIAPVFASSLPTQAELEPLQTVSNERLQPGELLDVLIDALVLELTQRVDDFVQLARVDVFAAQHATQFLRLLRVLTCLAAKLPDVLGGQTNRAALPPSTPRGSASPGAAAIVATAGRIASVAALLSAAIAACWPF